jgi:predicted enzyme related to lactoylglutathione lyase
MTARARWKELCMDTVGGEELGRFWADVLGLRFSPDAESGNVVGDVEGMGIAMRRVPEAKTVKHRVHLDVAAAAVEDLVNRGASVVRPAEESGLAWTVMADPEGGELCAFLRTGDLPDFRLESVVVDATDAEQIARWWGEVLDVEPQVSSDDDEDWWWLEDVAGLPSASLAFVPVPEPKTVKNRVHWDLYAMVGDLEAAGATVLREQDGEIRWTVMADPEGNEFCVFSP